MAAVFLEEPVDIRVRNSGPAAARSKEMMSGTSNETLVTELGLWLSGLESFLAIGHEVFREHGDRSGDPDTSREFRLVNSALQRCSLISSRILSSGSGVNPRQASVTWSITFGEIAELGDELRRLQMLANGYTNAAKLGPAEWRAWSSLVSSRLSSVAAFAVLIGLAEEQGDEYLPSPLRELANTNSFLSEEQSELALVLPKFGRILKSLSLVGRMLEADEPLKPALLIFARINEQVHELTNYINNRLGNFPNEEAEMFSSLDAAAYTASIELKKVYSQELAGLAGIRPSPSIYARMETAYALLNEGFQQMLAGFARMIDPAADVFGIFPNFALKRDQSLALRAELWSVVHLVQKAEVEPEKAHIDEMRDALRKFIAGTAKFLFYKDTETVERFIEEILVTKDNKDLVPILHRFGAFLETLFGQVNLRAVLEKHPFDPQR